MKKYIYIVVKDSEDIDWCFEYVNGTIEPVAAFSSKEEAEAVATLRNASLKRRFDEEASRYYVVRVPMYS